MKCVGIRQGASNTEAALRGNDLHFAVENFAARQNLRIDALLFCRKQDVASSIRVGLGIDAVHKVNDPKPTSKKVANILAGSLMVKINDTNDTALKVGGVAKSEGCAVHDKRWSYEAGKMG